MQNTPTDTSLHFHIAAMDVDGVRGHLERGANPNCADLNGSPAIWVATDLGNDRIVRLLLEAGADPDALPRARSTALMQAAARGYEQIASDLIHAGAEIDAQDAWGATALILAAESRNLGVVTLLLDARADPNVRTADGRSALSVAVWQVVENRLEGRNYYKRAVRVGHDDPLVGALVRSGARE